MSDMKCNLVDRKRTRELSSSLVRVIVEELQVFNTIIESIGFEESESQLTATHITPQKHILNNIIR